MGKDLKGNELGRGIRQRKDGRFEMRVSINRKLKSFYVRDIREIRQKLPQDISKSFILEKDLDSVYEVLKTGWKDSILETSIKSYEHQYEILKRYLPDVPLDEITPEMVRDTFRKLEEKYSVNMCKEIFRLLRKIERKTIETGIIDYSFTEGILISDNRSWLNDNQPETTRSILKQEEYETFRQACKESRYGDLFLFLLYSGLQLHEACMLRWEDINFEDQYIQTRGSSPRIVPFDQQVKVLLTQQKKTPYQSYGPVFTTRSGKELDSNYTAAKLRKVSLFLQQKEGWKGKITSTVLHNTFIYQKGIIEKMNPLLLAKILGFTYETCCIKLTQLSNMEIQEKIKSRKTE